MPELAAHLGRVARDLAQDSRAVYQTAYAKDMSKSVMERHEAALQATTSLLAAALAACAREARNEALEEAAKLVQRKILTRPANSEYVPSYGLADEIRALKRAAGESSLDPAGRATT